jgi:hypothetical protein
MPSWEELQNQAKTRYKQDVPGALKKALENNSPGSTGGLGGGTTGINGLARIAWNVLNDPDRPEGSGTEWHESSVFAACLFVLTVAAAP